MKEISLEAMRRFLFPIDSSWHTTKDERDHFQADRAKAIEEQAEIGMWTKEIGLSLLTLDISN